MRIDVHAHYFHPEYLDCLSRAANDGRTSHTARAPGIQMTPADIVGMLDETGVDMQVLSPSASQPYVADEGNAVTAARLCNDIYADLARQHAGRFAAFGSVPLPHVDAAIAEAARCLDTLGMVGINTGCSVLGRPLDDAVFEPFWAELDRRGAVLFLHPVGIGGPCMDAFKPGLHGGRAVRGHCDRAAAGALRPHHPLPPTSESSCRTSAAPYRS